MSMPFLIFSCDRCSFSGTSVVIWGKFSYESPSGLVSLNRILGWCNSCQGLVPIEILPTFPTLERIEKLELDIAQNKRLVAEHRAKATGGRSWLARLLHLKPHLPPEIQHIEFQTPFLENNLREGRNRYNLFSDRVKPRCLLCGGKDNFTLPENIQPLGSHDDPGPAVSTGVKHPGCGGTIMVQHSRDRVSVCLSHRVYDREGRLIRINDVEVVDDIGRSLNDFPYPLPTTTCLLLYHGNSRTKTSFLYLSIPLKIFTRAINRLYVFENKFVIAFEIVNDEEFMEYGGTTNVDYFLTHENENTPKILIKESYMAKTGDIVRILIRGFIDVLRFMGKEPFRTNDELYLQLRAAWDKEMNAIPSI